MSAFKKRGCMTIYDEICSKAEFEKIKIDFKKKNVIVGRCPVIVKGIVQDSYIGRKFIDDSFGFTLESSLQRIEYLYNEYKYSAPTEKSEYQKHYFKALSINEISDYHLIYGMNRMVAKVRLELYVFAMFAMGKHLWDEEKLCGKWFWQSEKDKDLIILREWFGQ